MSAGLLLSSSNEQMKIERILNKPLLENSSEKKPLTQQMLVLRVNLIPCLPTVILPDRTIKSFVLEKKNAILVQRPEK